MMTENLSDLKEYVDAASSLSLRWTSPSEIGRTQADEARVSTPGAHPENLWVAVIDTGFAFRLWFGGEFLMDPFEYDIHDYQISMTAARILGFFRYGLWKRRWYRTIWEDTFVVPIDEADLRAIVQKRYRVLIPGVTDS